MLDCGKIYKNDLHEKGVKDKYFHLIIYKRDMEGFKK